MNGDRPMLRAGLPVLLLVLVVAACNEEIVVEQDTVVYGDGTVYRHLELHGREGSGEIPDERGWLAKTAGVHLAEPGSWRVLEERPDGLAVEAVFAGAGQVPPSLAHDTDGLLFPGSGPREDRRVADHGQVRLEVQDLVVLTRRVYEETAADPFGPSSLEAALNMLTEVAVASLRDELRLELGEQVDPARAEAFLRTRGTAIAGELLGVLKEHATPHVATERARLLEAALDRHGIPPPGGLAESTDWGEALGMLLDPLLLWSREQVAGLVSTTEERFTGDDLSFWPDAEALGEILGTETDEPEPEAVTDFKRSAESLLRSMEGLYGDPMSPRFRFESRLELPGRLLRTNGTPGNAGILWVFDNRALTAGVTMRAETAEPNQEVLVTLGARRELDDADLLRICDLLIDPDLGEPLRELLARAVDEGRFDPLADEDLDSALRPASRELLEILDPSVTRWPQD